MDSQHLPIDAQVEAAVSWLAGSDRAAVACNDCRISCCAIAGMRC
jgi:hypothetical protein